MAFFFEHLNEAVFWLAIGYGLLAAVDMVLSALGRGLALRIPNAVPILLVLLFCLQAAVLPIPPGAAAARLGFGLTILMLGFLLFRADRTAPVGILKGFAAVAPILGWDQWLDAAFAFSMMCLAGALCALAIQAIKRA